MTAEAVVVPKDHEGVGKALRKVYLPRMADTPRDMWELLDKLN